MNWTNYSCGGADMAQLHPAIFIMGPTASGKTELAIELARHLPVELISVDSALVYRGMNIGTAKPEPELLAEFPHRLIDICEPTEVYSAARFCADALEAMAEISARGRIPLLVGGTMLYFHALQQGLSELPASNPVVRERLIQRLQKYGVQRLHQELQRVDAEIAQRIHANDTQRILRALEVFEQTGQPLSQLQAVQRGYRFPYAAVKLVRAPTERAVLHQRIASRFEWMLAQGFESEVRDLLSRPGIVPELPSMRAVGYRQMIEYIQGKLSKEEMLERGIIATRQLAKRQFTWLRREDKTYWLDETGNVPAQAVNVLKDLLTVDS